MKKYILSTLIFILFAPFLLAQKAVDVKSIVIKATSIEKMISKVGTAFSFRSVLVATSSEGLVEKLFFDEGQTVNKGQILAHVGEIDNKLLLQEAQNNLKKQRTNLAYNKKDYTRQANFYKKKIINLSQFELVKNQYQLSQISKDFATIQLQKAKINYGRATIKAPIAGIIDQKFFEVGEFARKGDQVYRVIQNDILKIKFAINESELLDFPLGQKAKISFDALARQEYRGVIKRISPSANIQTKTFQVEIEISNSNNEIRAGITSRVELKITKPGKHILIPLAAIVEGSKGKIVYLNKNSKAQEVLITTGENIGNKIVVKTGLNIADKLVIQGQQFLNNNEAINDLSKSANE